MLGDLALFLLFFFNDTATTEIYTLSLHDALPIFFRSRRRFLELAAVDAGVELRFLREELARHPPEEDRKSTRLNSSHQIISYAVFCLKKKNTTSIPQYSGTNASRTCVHQMFYHHL